MGRSFAAALTFVLAAPAFLSAAPSVASDRTLPMQFVLRAQGPAEDCGAQCRLLIAASGAVTAQTPQDFQAFARQHDLTGATVVLDSGGGSVHGAIALGREIRRLGLDTTVGRLSDIDGNRNGITLARLNPHAECESMCAFILIAGVHRTVPPEARVMVHQIWLGDRRDDPTAASYSAEDLVLVQRDIGRLAQYTGEMGASVDLLDLALRIPPWEPMHAMTRAEIRNTGVETPGAVVAPAATVATSPPPVTQPIPARVTNGVHATTISEQRWSMIDHSGSTVLARRHPLTIEGDDIGSFDLMVACGQSSDSYDVSYVERRQASPHAPLPRELGGVAMSSGNTIARLKVVSSERSLRSDELVTYATGSVPARLIGAFAGAGTHSMTVTTKSANLVTVIRLGNTGAQESLPQLSASCHKADRAEQAPAKAQKAHGIASAQ
jgi:hypothetical protein